MRNKNEQRAERSVRADHIYSRSIAMLPGLQVGCSTPERPSKQWIEGHADLYKDDWDEEVLKKVVVSPRLSRLRAALLTLPLVRNRGTSPHAHCFFSLAPRDFPLDLPPDTILWDAHWGHNHRGHA